MGLSPSARTAAPSEPKRSKPTPCSWGGLACPSRRRLWPAALPPPCSWACRRRSTQTAPFGTKRSAHAPCSWGMGASARRQRLWPAALPPPARGPVAVCPHRCPIRTETKQARPLLVGQACVSFAPKALAGGTAAPCSWACRRLPAPLPHQNRNEASPPPARGAGLRCPSRRRLWLAALPP